MTDPRGTTIAADGPQGGPPRVLELRVHGVNNTTPADLLDLPPFDVRQVRGDKRAGFWLAEPNLAPRQGERGHIPAGIRREAYSWGGLVREDAGKTKWAAAIAAALPGAGAALQHRQRGDVDAAADDRRRHRRRSVDGRG